MIIFYALSGTALFLAFFTVAYCWSKIGRISAKIPFVVKSVETLNREIFAMKKTIEQFTNELQSLQKEVQSVQDKHTDAKLSAISEHINTTLSNLEQNLCTKYDDFDLRMKDVEQIAKNFSLGYEAGRVDEGRIVELYKQGLGEDEIANSLKISPSEVKIALRFANIAF